MFISKLENKLSGTENGEGCGRLKGASEFDESNFARVPRPVFL
jgi:hypothetical protein